MNTVEFPKLSVELWEQVCQSFMDEDPPIYEAPHPGLRAVRLHLERLRFHYPNDLAFIRRLTEWMNTEEMKQELEKPQNDAILAYLLQVLAKARLKVLRNGGGKSVQFETPESETKKEEI